MAFSRFAELLKASMGLDAASIGASAIERAVRERQRACQLNDLPAYWTHVNESETELQALIEAVVVSETWFFRDGEAFAALGRLVQADWLRSHRTRVLRLLSLPCATGEEPYSMAMTLLDAGLGADRFRVDAVDISERVLMRGRRGVYRKSSFRGHDLSFRDRYFEATAAGERLRDLVRCQVDFRRANLLSPAFLPGAEIYDVIFCRNLLIYFDRATQDRSIGVLKRLLTTEGLLFAGAAETSLFLSHGFVPVKAPMAFAFRRASVETREPTPAPASAPRSTTLRSASTDAIAASLPTPPRAEPGVDLDEAMRLANEGRFAEAVTCCELHVARHGPSAAAFHLLGLVRDASGSQEDALAWYRKAIYLDPHHSDALMNLALLMEKLEKKTEAQILRARAIRVLQKSVT